YGSTLKLLASVRSSYVSKTQTHQIVIFVQERLPEIPVLLSLIPAGVRSYINLRVWFWLRTNAGGMPNTCKANETFGSSGARVRNAWESALRYGRTQGNLS